MSQRIRFGRHPDSEVSFDAHRDLDASSRHAELRAEGDLHVLCDVGSSNGTFIDGEQITELAIVPEVPVIVEFGAGGPRLRLFIGDPDTLPALPASAHARRWTAGWRGLVRVSLIAAVLALVVAMVVALI